MLLFRYIWIIFIFFYATHSGAIETIFLEAESFKASSEGWVVQTNQQTRAASNLSALNGATGDSEATAISELTIKVAGNYRIWVRHNYHNSIRGPFQVRILHSGKALNGKVFDLHQQSNVKNLHYIWDYFDIDLPVGSILIKISKYEEKNSSRYVRNVDCLLLTTDKDLKPNHLLYGPQTWLRVTLDDVYQKPLYIHVFADHYRSPWYSHWNLSRSGTNSGLYPPKSELLNGGEQTPWCNITPLIYQDSGAILNISARYSYRKRAERLKVRLDFAVEPKEKAIVHTMHVDSKPNGLVVVMPPNLATKKNLKLLKRDRYFSDKFGKLADSFDWPNIGAKPQQFPFLVSASRGGYGTDVDQSIQDRESKTLSYFGFSNPGKFSLSGKIWYMKNHSYCQPDIERMRKHAFIRAEKFFKEGKKIENAVFYMLTGEPAGQASEFIAQDKVCHKAFREWLKKLGKTPADLLLRRWDEAKPVSEKERNLYPALHYFTQRFRTRALGDFMAIQRKILEETYGYSLPTVVNFSDGATYSANFYGQGVDYFELLDSYDQNAIWSEDWANGASSNQCAAYNVDLMRAAAQDRGQIIGHYLIAHAYRKPWDIKLKAVSETARGVRIWKNFAYGMSWGSHEGGPAWKSHMWQNQPQTWRANAEIVREIGGAEDLLVSAKTIPAEVAVLYSSSSDAWTLHKNNAYGFNRMHTWMALTHAQVPVDFLSERQVERDGLKGYKVCYLSGPNLTRMAAIRLKAWVEAGGILYMTAGAGSHDEYNRPMDILDSLLAAKRKPLEELQPFLNSGSYLTILQQKDTVTAGDSTFEVLSVRQRQIPLDKAEVLAHFMDREPAIIRSRPDKGLVYSVGFLPALDYIKQALIARRKYKPNQPLAATNQGLNPTPSLSFFPQNKRKYTTANTTRLERSDNPWKFDAKVRELILNPVRVSKVDPPLTSSVPLVDAVVLQSNTGIIIPVANYTLAPLDKVEFTLRVKHRVNRIETVHQGRITFKRKQNDRITFSIPLGASDYIKIITTPSREPSSSARAI